MSVESRLRSALAHGDLAKRNKVYEEIYDAYRGLLYFVAAKFDLPLSLRDDAVADSFLAFFSYAKQENVASIKSFLVKTMERKCLDVLMQRKTEELEEDPMGEDEMGAFIADLKSLLSESDFDLLYDYVVCGYSSEEIARSRGLKPDAVRQRVKRIKAKVRSIMEV